MGPADAERRLVTVIYADLVGHTRLVARLDPEEWRAVLQRYFAAVVRPIQRYGGTVEKYIGDAVFAVFGVPRAHEDDAARAVLAAVEMQEVLRRLPSAFGQDPGARLAMRIGVATGQAVAPGAEGADQLVVGDLAALAERLQRSAPPGGIVLSERTFGLVGALVEGTSLGPLHLKGFPRPQRAVLLRRLLPEVPRQGAGGTRAPLVNRERELAELLAAAQRLRRGQGQIVFLIGEAGMGKSRLAAELRDRLDAGTPFLVARCLEFTRGVNHGVLLQWVRAWTGIGDLEEAAAAQARLAAALRDLFGHPAPQEEAALAYLLGLPAPEADGDPFRQRMEGMAPDEVGRELLRILTAFWERAAQRPLVLLAEDLHWVDAASAEGLHRLFDVTERAPLLLLCASRPERRSAAWDLRAAAERDYPHRYQEIRLGPLASQETERLAGVLLEQMALPADLRGPIAQRAEGNPFYVEEMVRALRQAGTPDAHLPDTLQGVLQARLDALPPPTRRVLQAAAVIGRTFPLRLLQVLAGDGGDLWTHLLELQRADFLQELERIPEPSFAFRHLLLQEAAYQTLLRRERRTLHLRLAETLEREERGGPAVLGYHFRLAEAWEKAFAYALRAGEAARSLAAFQEALAHYDAALAVARDHPDSVADAAAVVRAELARGECLWPLGRLKEMRLHHAAMLRRHAPPRVRVEIHRGIARAYSMTGDLRKARQHLEHALSLLQRKGDPLQEAGVYREMARIMERRRRYPEARAFAERALTIAREHALQPLLSDIYAALTTTHFFGGDLGEALRCAEEALRRALAEDDQPAIIRSRNNLANLLLFTGRLGEAEEQAATAVALAEGLGLVVPLVLPQVTVAEILLERGRWAEARAVLDAVDDRVRRHDLGASWRALLLREQAFLDLAEEAWAEALRRLEEARALEERTGISRHLPKTHRGLAEAYLGLGDPARARVHAARVRILERGSNPIETPAAMRVLAVLSREAGSVRRALHLLEAGRGLLAQRRVCSEHARILLELARTRMRAGRRVAARQAAAEALAIAEEVGSTSLVDAARRAAAEL